VLYGLSIFLGSYWLFLFFCYASFFFSSFVRFINI
jgi:hypothetical protein